MKLQLLHTLLNAASLVVRGSFHPDTSDGVPLLSNGNRARTIVLAGNTGPDMWQTFVGSAEYRDEAPDPLDRWTQRVLQGIVAQLDTTGLVEPLYPFGGPPYLPFQRWAQRAEAVWSSPTGPLIHPDYGLWHAYIGALAFEDHLDLTEQLSTPSPCDSCTDQPCLQACPVDAFDGQSYDVPACTDFMMTKSEGTACRLEGCLARRACPVGRSYTYSADQSEFHTGAFLRARQGETG